MPLIFSQPGGAMADSADLVVLGGYLGTGNKGGMCSVFLMGCYCPTSDMWKTVCKVGNGYVILLFVLVCSTWVMDMFGKCDV